MRRNQFLPHITSLFGSNYWTLKGYFTAGPFTLISLQNFKGERTHRNSEGWEKYELYDNLTLLITDGDGYNLSVLKRTLEDNKRITDEILRPLMDNFQYVSNVTEDEVLIDCY